MLLEKIKADSLKARKEKDSIKSSLLTTLYSEALMLGKNKRNDLPTDEETLCTVHKFLKNANETKSILKNQLKGLMDNIFKIDEEIKILESYIPVMMSEEELVILIGNIIRINGNNLGIIMKKLKENYNGLYDGKIASTIVKELIGAV